MYTGKVVLKDGNLDLERVTVAAYSGFKSSKIWFRGERGYFEQNRKNFVRVKISFNSRK